MSEKIIQTEVDRLVSLVKSEERISVKDAAKRLSMPASTVKEWASFLEEEGIINIEYKFTIPFLVSRKLSDSEQEEIRGTVEDEKEILQRKSESTMNYLSMLDSEIDSLKDLFSDLETHFSKRMSVVKKEFAELKSAELEKEKLNKQLVTSKQQFMKTLTDVNKQMNQERVNNKAMYNLLFNEAKLGNQILGIQQEELKLITSTDRLLEKKLKHVRKCIDKEKAAKLQDKDKLTRETKMRLVEVENSYSSLQERLDKERETIEKLIKQNKEQEKQINALKKQVLSKLKTDDAKVDKAMGDVKDVAKKLKQFLDKKNKVMQIVNRIDYDEKMLKEKLKDIMKRGSSLAGESVISELEELERKVADISKKRGSFEFQIKKIFKLLKS